MIGKLQGLFKKMNQDVANAMDQHHDRQRTRHPSRPPHPPPPPPPPRPPHPPMMHSGVRPNPLLRRPSDRHAHQTAGGGAINRPVNPLQTDHENDAQRVPSNNGNRPGPPSTGAQPQPPQQQQNQTTNGVILPPLYAAPASPTNGTTGKPSELESAPQVPPSPTKPGNTMQQGQRTQDQRRCSASKGIAAEDGLRPEGSSGDYSANGGSRPDYTFFPATRVARPHSPPAPPPATTSVSVAPNETSAAADVRRSNASTNSYHYSGCASGEYDSMRRTTPDGRVRASDDYGDVLGLFLNSPGPVKTTTTTGTDPARTEGDKHEEKAEAVTALPPVATAQQQHESGQCSVFPMSTRMGKKNNATNQSGGAQSGGKPIQQDFSSGSYDTPYTFMNRPVNSASTKRTDAALHTGDEKPNPFKSRVTQHRTSDSTTDHFQNDKSSINSMQEGKHTYSSNETTGAPPLYADKIPRNDSSASQLVEPSKLRRANDLALSKWKYVAMVVQKVAEKKTQVRESRLRLNRRSSLLVAQGLSVVPLERRNSAKSDESLIFAPEEEQPVVGGSDADVDDVDSLEVSVYDESGEPLLIPNLSELYSDRPSEAANGISAVYDESDSNEDESAPAPPQQQQLSAEPQCPPAQSPNGVYGGMFRYNRQNVAPQQQQQYGRAQDPRYRQKMIQQQRQQLLLQQQRLQQYNYSQHPQPPPPRPHHEASPIGRYSPINNGGTNYSNSPSMSSTALPNLAVGTTGRPYPQPDIQFGPRLVGGRSRYIDISAITGIRLEDAQVINSPMWAALEPARN